MDWWLQKHSDSLVAGFVVLLSITYLIYPIYKKRKNRLKLGTRDEEGRPLGIEDPEALAKAEDWAQTYDYRKDWAERGYVILKEFDSLHGFTATYMEDLVTKMTTHNLRVTYESIQSTPAGVATINQLHSVHILHCHKEDFEAAEAYLERLFR